MYATRRAISAVTSDLTPAYCFSIASCIEEEQVVLPMTQVTFKNGTSIITAWYILDVAVSEVAVTDPLLGKMFFCQLQQFGSVCPWQPVLGTLKLCEGFLNHIPDVSCLCALKGNKVHLYIHME